MRRASKILAALLLLLALLVATGFVMARNRRMSLFLSAKDRLARGEDRHRVLSDLAGEVDWEAEEPVAAEAIAAEALGAAGGPRPTVHRAGGYALVRRADGTAVLLERRRGRWTPSE